jgi:hypothetical protein
MIHRRPPAQHHETAAVKYLNDLALFPLRGRHE